MQAELEKWIERNQRERYNGGGIRDMTVTVRELRALLAGKVLCDAKPRFVYTYDRLGYYVVSPNAEEAERDFPGRQHYPLYAPASPLGNADIGKGGGE